MHPRLARVLAGAGFALLLGASGAPAQQPAGEPRPHHPAHYPAHHPAAAAVLAVDDYLNCVRGCNQIFGAVEGAEATVECIRGCRWTSSRESLAPEEERQ